MALPVRIAQNDIGSAVESVLVRAVKEPAQVRLHVQHVEVIPTRFVEPGVAGRAICVQASLVDLVGRHSVKCLVPVAQIDVVGIRIRGVVFLPYFNLIDALAAGHIQRPQHQRIQEAEHHRVRANAQRQRHHGHQRETGSLAQLAQGESQVLQQNGHNRPPWDDRSPWTWRAIRGPERRKCNRMITKRIAGKCRFMGTEINVRSRRRVFVNEQGSVRPAG